MGRLLKKNETPNATPTKSFALPKLKSTKPEGLLTKLYKDSLNGSVPSIYSRNHSMPSILDSQASIIFQDKTWKTKTLSIVENKENIINNIQTPKKSAQKISQLKLQKIVSQQKEGPVKTSEISTRAFKKLEIMVSPNKMGSPKAREVSASERKGSYESTEEGSDSGRKVQGLSESRSQLSVRTEKKRRISLKKIMEEDSGSPCVVFYPGRRATAFKIVANNSYFNVIKTSCDKSKLLEEQKAFHSRVVKMKERINNLRTNIGENFVPQ